MSLARAITSHFKGEWTGNQGLIPAPGHSSKDRGISVKDSADGNDVVLHSFNDANFDWRAFKDALRLAHLLPEREVSREQRRPTQSPAPAAAATPPARYVYRDIDAKPVFRMVRGANKRFHVEHPSGATWVAGMNGSAPIPYRLPELVTAHPDATVYICEGEKDADNLAALGFVTTTNPNGAGKWREAFSHFLKDRSCVILPDNDAAGRDHAEDVALKLKSSGIDAVILALPGLPEKGDVSDWIAMGGNAETLIALTEAAYQTDSDDKPEQALLPLINPASWVDVETPSRQWAMDEWMPLKSMTYLTGAGSAGKSLLAQQMATSMASGVPFLGVSVRETVSVYITCEDDEDELHRRQKAICDGTGIQLRGLGNRLHLISLAGSIGNELATFDPLGRMSTTDRWNELRATILKIGAGFIALDNVAHFFSGNENIRNQVAAFCSLGHSLAQDTGGAVLLIGHPNKAGDAFSGSTAWENQVRSRIFMGPVKDASGAIIDADAREMSRQKSNYAKNGESVKFRWHKWAFMLDNELPEDARAEVAATLQAQAENAEFLKMLALTAGQKRAVSHVKGTNWFGTVFARMPEAKGQKPVVFEQAFERLVSIGKIELDQPLWQDAHYKWKQGIKLVEKSGDPPTATPSGDPRRPHGQVVENTSGDHRPATPLYINISGAASGVGAPDTVRPEDGASTAKPPVF